MNNFQKVFYSYQKNKSKNWSLILRRATKFQETLIFSLIVKEKNINNYNNTFSSFPMIKKIPKTMSYGWSKITFKLMKINLKVKVLGSFFKSKEISSHRIGKCKSKNKIRQLNRIKLRKKRKWNVKENNNKSNKQQHTVFLKNIYQHKNRSQMKMKMSKSRSRWKDQIAKSQVKIKTHNQAKIQNRERYN